MGLLHRPLGSLLSWGVVVAFTVAVGSALGGCGSEVSAGGSDGAGIDAVADAPSLPGDTSWVPDAPPADITKPDITKPDTTKPDTTKPDGTAPDATGPDAMRPDVPPRDVPSPDVPPPAECDSDDDCDDEDDCTSDLCDDDGTCSHAPTEGFCHIDGDCYEAGEVDPDNPCRACVPAVVDDDWSADDTLSCGSPDACATWACRAGACVASSHLACDDRNPCTEDRCEPDRGCAYRPASGPCDDGNRCTRGDHCSQGLCLAGGESLACDDGDLCTNDECDPARGCVHTPNTLSCDDGDACTTNDRCAGGDCAGQATVRCDDGNACTDDWCDARHGCLHADNTAECDDGDPCTGGDRCVGRVCVPGSAAQACDDGNLCTDDSCTPGVGCEYRFNEAPCDDGSACTTDDRCQSGACRGVGGVDCDDDDPCTLDTCDAAGGCRNEPLEGAACDDGRGCTRDDVCSGGVCAGTPIPCDDGNGCTIDVCVEPIGCRSELAVDDAACALRLVVTEPARGVALGPDALVGGAVPIRGYVESPADPSPSLSLDGQPLALTPGAPMGGPPNPTQPLRFDFDTRLAPEHAMNLVRLQAGDAYGRVAKRTQSFYFSSVYWPVTANDFQASRIPAGLVIGLSQAFVDDNDATLNDLAAIVDRIIANLDLMSLVPSPVSQLSQLGCTYNVYLTSATFGTTDTDIVITSDGLALALTLNNLRIGFRLAYVDGGFWCPGTQTGTATATAVDVDTRIVVNVVNGQVQAILDPASTSATMRNLSVTIDSWFLDLIVGLFEGTIQDMLETQIADAIRDQFGPILASVFDALLIDVDIDIPSFFPGGQAATVSLRTAISAVAFAAGQHMKLELDAAVFAAHGVPYASPGALGYANCLRTPFTRNSVDFGVFERINLGLFDDVANQILHAAWETGAFELTLGPDVIPVDQLTQFGVADLDVTISLLLPPVLTSCKPPTLPDAPDDAVVVEMGDMRVDAAFSLNGAPVALTLYASLTGAATLGAAQNDAGEAEIGIEILGFGAVETDLVSIDAPDATTAGLVSALIDTALIPLLLEQLDFGGPIGFALPVIDLSSPESGIPEGTAFAIQPTIVYRTGNANTIAKGTVAPPN